MYSSKTIKSDQRVHSALNEMRRILEDVKKHQMQISEKQCRSMDELVNVLGGMLKRQGKLLKEVLIGNRIRQIQYETTLNVLAEQQRQTIELLKRWTASTEDDFVTISKKTKQ